MNNSSYLASCRRIVLQLHRWSAGSGCPRTSPGVLWSRWTCCTLPLSYSAGPQRRCPQTRRWSPRPNKSHRVRTWAREWPPSCPWCGPPPSCPFGNKTSSRFGNNEAEIMKCRGSKFNYLTRRTVKEPSFMPRASWEPSLLKETLRTASSMLQRAINVCSDKFHSLNKHVWGKLSCVHVYVCLS